MLHFEFYVLWDDGTYTVVGFDAEASDEEVIFGHEIAAAKEQVKHQHKEATGFSHVGELFCVKFR